MADLIIAIAALIVSAVVGILAIVGFRRDGRKDAQSVKEELDEYRVENEHRISRVETKIDLYWKTVEKRMSEVIHSPHTPEVDILLDKLTGGMITHEETLSLKIKLESGLKSGEYSNGKVCAAKLLLSMVDLRIEGILY